MSEPRVDLSRYDQSWFSRGRSNLIVGIWDLFQTFFIHPSPHSFHAYRRWCYLLFGAKVGPGTHICATVKCNYPWKLTLGSHVWIGEEATLYALDHITIEDNAVVSQQAYLCTGAHDPSDPHFGLIVKPIIVRHSAWIALGAVVLPGVEVKAGALLAARTVLTKDAEAWTVYAGVPAKAIGRRELLVT